MNIIETYQTLSKRQKVVAEILIYIFLYNQKKGNIKIARLQDSASKNKWIYQIEVEDDD